MLATPIFSTIITGQTIIPVGTRTFSINVISGSAVANDVLLNQGTVWSYQAADSKVLLGSSIAVGTTGFSNRVTILYIV